jgi:hypothetical protein
MPLKHRMKVAFSIAALDFPFKLTVFGSFYTWFGSSKLKYSRQKQEESL